MAQMPAEDSERRGFPAWMASGSAVCPCPLGIGWEMLVGSRDPNMLFHSSFTFESCFTCFLAISNQEGEKKNHNHDRIHSGWSLLSDHIGVQCLHANLLFI